MLQYKNTIFSLLLLTAFLVGCNPKEDDKIDIGAPPQNASFDIVPTSHPNYFTLKSTADGTFLHQWTLGNGNSVEGKEVEAYYPIKGTYEITLTIFTRGGHAISNSTITIETNDPDACDEAIRFLTACDQKTWKLEPMEGALFVGQSLTSSAWWQNSAADVVERECHFNDEYIFYADGRFEYKSNGDFWADDDGNGNVSPSDLGVSIGCQPSTAWPDKYKAWDSGVHAYTATTSQLTISGLGAWMGLYKVGTTSEVTTPQMSVTYNILEIDDNRMVIYVDYGFGVWRFTLVSS